MTKTFMFATRGIYYMDCLEGYQFADFIILKDLRVFVLVNSFDFRKLVIYLIFIAVIVIIGIIY